MDVFNMIQIQDMMQKNQQNINQMHYQQILEHQRMMQQGLEMQREAQRIAEEHRRLCK